MVVVFFKSRNLSRIGGGGYKVTLVLLREKREEREERKGERGERKVGRYKISYFHLLREERAE